MKIYKVSPIVKYSPFFSLTYVSKEEFEIGNIVPINFNNRNIFAVVLEVFNLRDAKVEIRKADFQTKKIENRIEKEKENLLPKKIFLSLQKFSAEFLIPVGEIIFFIWGEKLDEVEKLKAENKKENSLDDDELVCYSDELSLKVNKNINSAKGAEIFRKILADYPETIIIKDFNFDKYLNFQAPHISKLDLLFAILENTTPFAWQGEKKIILETDFLGVVETNWVSENIIDGKLFGKFFVEVQEKIKPAKKYLVKTDRDENGEEVVMADEAVEKLRCRAAFGRPAKKSFLFVLSHGFADRVFCNDCKKSYDCENCGHAFSLLNEEDGRYLFCKNCKNKKILKDDQYLICKHCSSWRLFPFGIGVQKVKNFLSPEFSENTSVIDESEKKLSAKKISDQIKHFLTSQEQNILIGSLRTLQVLKNLLAKDSKEKTIDQTFIISTGPLVRGTTFDSDEKFVKLISEIENFSDEIYINKRTGDEVALENYKSKKKFVEEEIIIRKSLGLPPETKIVSLFFNFRVKKNLDKFLMQNFEKYKQSGEIKKGQNYIYYWLTPKDGKESNELKEKNYFFQTLRQFGDLTVANSIIEQSVLGKK